MSILILDGAMQVLSVVDARKGLNYIVKNKGVSLLDTDRMVSPSSDMHIPAVVMLKQAHAHKSYQNNREIKWSKKGVLRRDSNVCAYCGDFGNTVDHIVPKDLGGGNAWLNTITACKPCNGKKANKPLEDTGMKLLFAPSVPTRFKRYITRSLTNEQKEFLITCGLDDVLN